MANLIQHDTFDPYYAGRDDDARRSAKPRAPAKQKQQSGRSTENEIVLPEEAPAPAGETRRDRRPIAH